MTTPAPHPTPAAPSVRHEGETMTAQKLRDAAKVLRERAEEAPPGPWIVDGITGNVTGEPLVSLDLYSQSNQTPAMIRDVEDEGTVRYIATVDPLVGLALADWLDAEADERRWGRSRDFDAVGISDRIANLILGADA